MATSAMTRRDVENLMNQSGRGVRSSKYSTSLYDEFPLLISGTQGASVSANWDLTGAGTPTCAFATDGGGIVLGTTAADGGSDNDAASMFPLAASAWGVSRLPNGTRRHRLATTIQTGASVASYCVQVGFQLTDTAVYKTDADQFFLFFDTDAVDIDPASGYADLAAGMTTFYVMFSKGGSDYLINTGVRVTASTEYQIALEIDTDSRPVLYIDRQKVDLSALPTMTTSAALKPFARVLERVANSTKTLTVRYMHYLGK